MIAELLANVSTPLLLLVLAVSLTILAKGADLVVNEAVVLSLRLNVPTAVIGATVVSLGTTLPEASVSVVASLKGFPELALGNAVGSIICDSGLILGIGALIRPLPLDRQVIGRQGWMQIGAAVLLVILCLPFSNLGGIFVEGGTLPQWGGILLVILLAVYLWWSFQLAKNLGIEAEMPVEEAPKDHSAILAFLILALGIGMVVGSSFVTIPTAEILAVRAGVPPEVIAVSLVAFGTSLPELVTVVASVLKGRGELAIGNVIGADILNVLFVAGLSTAVTPGGLEVSPVFFKVFFPVMLGLLVIFRIAVFTSKTHLGRGFGALLVAIYLAFLYFNYT